MTPRTTAARRPFVAVVLRGGLGNQLFQYALGRELAAAEDAVLLLDESRLSRDVPPRTYALGPHARHGHRLGHLQAWLLRRMHRRRIPGARLLVGALHPGLRREPLRHVPERGPGFDPTVLSARGNLLLSGYWQSPRYFRGVAEDLRRELAPAGALPPPADDLLLRIGSVESVGVHVRRGDYVASDAVRRRMAVCGASYYAAAVEVVRRRVRDPVAFVFSNDPDWCRDHLRLDLPTTIVSMRSDRQDEHEFRLLAACRHHVIANSTWSWWAAWLGARPGQVVVAPAAWYAAPEAGGDDVYEDGWLRA